MQKIMDHYDNLVLPEMRDMRDSSFANPKAYLCCHRIDDKKLAHLYMIVMASFLQERDIGLRIHVIKAFVSFLADGNERLHKKLMPVLQDAFPDFKNRRIELRFSRLQKWLICGDSSRTTEIIGSIGNAIHGPMVEIFADRLPKILFSSS